MNDRPMSIDGMAGEPQGPIPVDITKETLTLDFRGLVRAEPVSVEAVYHLENRHAPIDLHLCFHLGEDQIRTFFVWLDETPIPVGKPHHGGMSVTGKDNKREVYDAWLVPVQVHLTTGQHTLKVLYEAEPGRGQAVSGVKTWFFAYVLEPAKHWKSFGGLDLQVLLPERWSYTCNVPLQRRDSALLGHFTNLPVNYLTFHVHHPVSWLVPWRWPCFVSALVAGGWLCPRRGKAFSPVGSTIHRWMLALFWAGVWSGCILVTGIMVLYLPTCGVPTIQVHTSIDLFWPLSLGALCIVLLFAGVASFLEAAYHARTASGNPSLYSNLKSLSGCQEDEEVIHHDPEQPC